MIFPESTSMIPERGEREPSPDRPYRQICVAAVAAALDAEVALEIAIANLAGEAHKMVLALRGEAREAAAA